MTDKSAREVIADWVLDRNMGQEPPAPMTAERYSIERIRRAQILEPVGAQQFAQHTYASDIRALLEQYDALTARVAELERAEHLVPNPHCGLSTNGVNVQGDEVSIKAVRDWLHSHTAVVPVLRNRAQAAEAKLYAAMDALTFILPLAKGYAHEHPVGANQRHVDEAAETLRALQTKDTTE